MRATPRITWLILSLGFLCHNVCSNDPTETPKPTTTTAAAAAAAAAATTTTTTAAAATTTTAAATTTTTPTTSASTASISKATTAVTSVPTKATTLSVSTNQKTSPIHTITTVTSTQAAATTVKQPVTESATESVIPKGSSPKATSSASTAVITDSSKSMALTVMPSSSSSAGSAAVTEPLQISAKVTTTGTDTMYAPTQTSKAPAITVSPTTSQGNNQKGSTESSEPTKRHSALTTVETTITGVSSTSLSRTTQAPTTKTPDLTKKTVTVTSVPSSTTTLPQLHVFLYSQNIKEEPKDKTLGGVCKRLMVNFADGNCTLKYVHHNGTLKIYSVETSGKVNASIAQQYYDELNTNPKDNKTLIAILASCVALLIMIVILAACASHHRKPYSENQQHLTEELQTVENGYHDNPTLEVMEVQPEMQEKKVVLNGEFNDSWIVPFDNLLKEDMPDEEDTHL